MFRAFSFHHVHMVQSHTDETISLSPLVPIFKEANRSSFSEPHRAGFSVNCPLEFFFSTVTTTLLLPLNRPCHEVMKLSLWLSLVFCLLLQYGLAAPPRGLQQKGVTKYMCSDPACARVPVSMSEYTTHLEKYHAQRVTQKGPESTVSNFFFCSFFAFV